MASENVVPPTNPDLEDLVFWLDEVKLDENSEEGPQVSLEILLGKLCNHMAKTVSSQQRQNTAISAISTLDTRVLIYYTGTT